MKVATKSIWHALPKPLLFGLYGAFGGLLGATIFGEAVWWLLRPSAPKVAAPPPLRLAASPAVDLYQGGANRFSVKIAREKWDAPVAVKVIDPPTGVQIGAITIPENRGEAEVEVRATADAVEGPTTITLKAEGPAPAGSPSAQTTIRLTVRKTSPPPPALRMGVSPEVVLEQSGQNRFGVVIARDYFSGPVVLDFGGLPQGVTAAGLVVPSEATRIEVELKAAADAAVGTTNVSVTAIGPRGPAEAPSPPVAMSRLSLTVNAPKPQPAIDVLFVLDVTGSMQYAIDGVRDGIIEFARGLEESKLDARVGLLAFRDRLETNSRFPALMRRALPKSRAPARSGRKRRGGDPKTAPTTPAGGDSGEEPFLIEVAGEVFTKDYAEFGREVGRKLKADGGGDTPESSLDALAVAAGQEFRKEATRVLILITDAPPKIPDKEMQSVDDVADILKKNVIDQLHLVINDPFRSVYSPLQRDAPGTIFNLESAARGGGFAAMLPKVSREIARITTAGQPPVPEPSATSNPKPPGPPPVEAAKALAAIAAAGRTQERTIAGNIFGRKFDAPAPGDRCLDRCNHGDDCDGPVRRARALFETGHPAFGSGVARLGGRPDCGPRRRRCGPAPVPCRSRRAGKRSSVPHTRLDAPGIAGRARAGLLRSKPSVGPRTSGWCRGRSGGGSGVHRRGQRGSRVGSG